MPDDKKTATVAPEPPEPDPNEGPGKGKAFFDRARTVAATGNYDFAINMYIEGLFREPFNVDEHKALREVAFKRKLGGAKSNGGGGGGFLRGLGLGGPKLPYPKGKSAKEAMLNCEFTLSMEVGDINAMLGILRNADILKLVPVILWIGPMIKEANRTSKQPKVEVFVEIGEVYAKHDEFERACDALNSAFHLKPTDMELKGRADTFAAQATIKRGKYGEGGDFKASIKDVEKTKELLQEENLARSEEYRTKILSEARLAYEANPKEMQVINKYSKALIDMEDEKSENTAVEVLRKAYDETRIYRFKATIDDIQMRQRKRNMRIMKEAYKTNPQDKDLLHQLEQLNKDRIAFDLSVFQERSEHMPTDMDVKYELGVRYWEAKRFDEAIVAFQEAQANPKRRVEALHLLGRSFLHQRMLPEAVETLKRAIDEYDLASTGDKKSKELHYWYARALEENKNTEEAKSIYSKVIQWEMGYLDARKRLDNLRGQNP